MLTFDELVSLVGSKQRPLLVAIDGLPLSGKTTLALRLIKELGAECLGLDDLVRPEAEWSSRDKPSFPFDFVRYGEFVDAVRSLAHNRRCSFHPYNWETGRIEGLPKVVRGDGIALVEGVSALHPDLAPLYDLRIWIESDAETTLAASFKRGVGSWAHEWEFMFLPSVELYLQTDPKARADVVALGRGLHQQCRRKIEMSLRAQSRNDTVVGGGHDECHTASLPNTGRERRGQGPQPASAGARSAALEAATLAQHHEAAVRPAKPFG